MSSTSNSSDRGGLATYLSRIRRIQPLSRAEERDLVESGGDYAEELIQTHLNFVARIAGQYRSMGVPLEDLINEGNLGLIEAARRFDVDRGTRFVTYAVWWIRKSILVALAERTSLVRRPRSLAYRLQRIRQARETLRKSLDREPTREEISEFIAESPQQVERALRTAVYVSSLDEPVSDEDDATHGELLATPAATPEQQILDRELAGRLGAAFRRLTRREQTVVILRLGLGHEPPQSLHEVGRRLGVSRERARQIEMQAKKRLRQFLRATLGSERRKRLRQPPPPPTFDRDLQYDA